MTLYGLHLSPDGKDTANGSNTRLPVAESLKNMSKTAFKGLFDLSYSDTRKDLQKINHGYIFRDPKPLQIFSSAAITAHVV